MGIMRRMTHRERTLAVLNYKPYDFLPLVHFGFWHPETMLEWAAQGHVTEAEARAWGDGNEVDLEMTRRLGFDFNWATTFGPHTGLRPGFPVEVVKEFPDGSQHLRNWEGVIVLKAPGATSIPAEIEHTLVDRASWEKHYLPRYEWHEDRILAARVRTPEGMQRWDEGGLEFLKRKDRDLPLGLGCGSGIGAIRNIVGVENLAYLREDDPELLGEIIRTTADLAYRLVKQVLEAGAVFDYGHFWEDICYRNGPLVNPDFFREKVGPVYARMTGLLREHGIGLCSVDSDGCIDALVGAWLKNGVNVMFPIEVGTWHASLAPWRKEFGRELRGVGGMNKNVLAADRAAVDAEVERLKPLVEMGGFLPCPDHRLPPGTKWELVRYYTGRMREVFGGP